MAVTFNIEKILPLGPHGQYLLIRPTDPHKPFWIFQKSFLQGIELEPYLEMPRKVPEDGGLETNVFAVKIKSPTDISLFSENSVVELIPGDAIHYLEPWYAINKDFATQLHRELHADHILHGAAVRTIARREDNDDVLFEVINREYQFAKVHLTWQGMQPNGHWPRTMLYKDWKEVYENVILPDHTEYNL